MIEPGSWRRRTRWTRLTYGLLAIAAVVLLVLDRPETRPAFFNALRSGSDDLTAPLMSGVSAPFSGLRSLRQAVDNHWAVHRQNEELRTQLEEMESWRQLALSLRNRVSAYESILDVPSIEAYDPIAAWTVAESGGPFQQARLMWGGADKGLKPGHPVLTNLGLIGRVISVSQRSSRVLLLNDAASRVPVVTEDGEVRAVLVGDNTTAPRLEFIDGTRPLQMREPIITSGDEGLFPPGLPVGEAGQAGDGSWRVRLYSSNGPSDAVWVYPYERIPPPPPEGVTPISPDPPELSVEELVQDINAAGDAESAGTAVAETPAPAAPAPAPVSEAPAPIVVPQPDPEPETVALPPARPYVPPAARGEANAPARQVGQPQ